MFKNLTLIFISLLFTSTLLAQPAKDYAVQLNASVLSNEAGLKIYWNYDANATQYQLFRKFPSDVSWGTGIASLSGIDSFYNDSSAIKGLTYEYKIQRNGSSPQAAGYMTAGFKIPEYFDRKKAVLIIDTTVTSNLSILLEQFKMDLVGDGYTIQSILVSPSESVTAIKTQITNIHYGSNLGISKIILIGNVPVPYSGDLNPDAHTNHKGAWPSDAYYGETNGNWSDISVNNTSASDSRNHNIPGDGKFDQSYFSSDVDIPVGRIDFSNLPAFTKTHSQLLADYFINNNLYRHANIPTRKRALIDDNFGGFGGEAFAASAWRVFPTFYSSDSVKELDYRTTLATQPYQFSYGCGAGSHTSCSGIGTTTNLSGDSLQTIFTLLFGSYFGDWDKSNSFLRAAVAQGTTLCNIWAGRPWYTLHTMATGEPIGNALLLSQNNNGSMYYSPIPSLAKTVQMSLIGDPTLRLHPISTASNFSINNSGSNIAQMTWTASTDTAVIGYHIFKSKNLYGPYQWINKSLITGTSFSDSCLWDTGTHYYMIRALKLERTFTGNYYNLSQGVFSQVNNSTLRKPTASFNPIINQSFVHFDNTSSNASHYKWFFGDGDSAIGKTTSHSFLDTGTYKVILIAYDGCANDTSEVSISINSKNVGITNEIELSISPNPTTEFLNIILYNSPNLLTISDVNGKITHQIESPKSSTQIDVRDFSPGVYYLSIYNANSVRTEKFMVY